MTELCDVCKRECSGIVRATVDGKVFIVCSFACKDEVLKGRKQDIGCGIIDGSEVRDVNMCNECTLFSMPFNCYKVKRDQGRALMFVGYGRSDEDER